jgi:Bacterial protein of unknown function (DUF839)
VDVSARPPGTKRSGGWHELLNESPAFEVLNFPDTLTVAPGGTLIVCGDGIGTTVLRGITTSGELFTIAYAVDTRNDVTGPNVRQPRRPRAVLQHHG